MEDSSPVPDAPDLDVVEAIGPIVELLRGKKLVLLTGAGVSTESGIPDYRGPKTRHKTRNPILYKEFIGAAENRQRYWARSAVGWPRFLQAQPNDAHRAIAAMEHAGLLSGLITQNVDRLHHKAGSQHVIELHGALAEVRCLDCELIEERDAFQDRLLALNPDADPESAGPDTPGTPELAPDGDAVLDESATRGFQVPPCLRCSGTLKPNVVFFGENVPRARVEAAWRMVDEADAMLVVGSSLTVYSGYRFIRGADERGMPVVIINLGETRGDPHASLRLHATAGLAIPALVDALVSSA